MEWQIGRTHDGIKKNFNCNFGIFINFNAVTRFCYVLQSDFEPFRLPLPSLDCSSVSAWWWKIKHSNIMFWKHNVLKSRSLRLPLKDMADTFLFPTKQANKTIKTTFGLNFSLCKAVKAFPLCFSQCCIFPHLRLGRCWRSFQPWIFSIAASDKSEEKFIVAGRWTLLI